MTSNWHLGMLFPTFCALLVSCLVWTAPESPRWLMQAKGVDRAVEALKRVRSGDTSAEGREMEAKMIEDRNLASVSYASLWTQKNLRFRVFVASWLQVMQKFTFIDVYFNFWPTITLQMGMQSKDANAFMTIFTLAGFVGSVVSMGLMDTKCGGRKRLLLLSSVIVLVSHVVIAGLVDPQAKVPMVASKAALMVYLFGWQLAWGTVCWIIPSELFSMTEKGPALAVPTFVQFALNPVAGAVAAYIIRVNFQMFFYVAAVMMVCHIIFTAIIIRETKGVPLEQVPVLYGQQRTDEKVKA